MSKNALHARRLEGKGAIVTGAGPSQIGQAIAHRLAQEGASVVCADIDLKAAQHTAERVSAATSTACIGLQADMSDEQAVKAMIAEACKHLPELTILVNNAVQFVFASATEATSEEWDRALGVNVKGYAFGLKHAARHMLANKIEGSIVNVASISAFIAQKGFVPYSATKAAVVSMSRNSALDLGGHQPPIRCTLQPAHCRITYKHMVNAVCPGPILTDGTRRQAASAGVPVEAIIKELTDMMVLRRMGTPEEVAAAVAFLASPEASFITGTALMVDGGYTVQ